MATSSARKTAARKAPARKATGARAAPGATAGAVKPAATPAKPRKAAAPAKAGRVAKPDKAKEAKEPKPRKPKLVRDSFSMPKTEYAVLQALKDRAAKAGRPARKSELLRAGIQVLAGMQDAAFLGAMGAVPTLKTGRPAKA